MRKKIEKNFWEMEIIGNRRKRSQLRVLGMYHFGNLKNRKLKLFLLISGEALEEDDFDEEDFV